MINVLIWVGRLAGILGLLLGVTAVGARAGGMWLVGGMQVGTLMLGSVAAMALGALAYAASVAEGRR